MFSAGQESRMTNYINSSLSTLSNKASKVIIENGGGNTDTGITDQEEDNSGK